MKTMTDYKQRINDMLIKASHGWCQPFSLIGFNITDDELELVFVVKKVSNKTSEQVQDIIVDLEVMVASELQSTDTALGVLMNAKKWKVKVLNQSDLRANTVQNITYQAA